MARWTEKELRPLAFLNLRQISNTKAILLVLIAGAIVYYFAIHRRR